MLLNDKSQMIKPRVGKIPWVRNGYLLQDSGLENSMCTWNSVQSTGSQSRTQLSDFYVGTGLVGRQQR